VLLQINDRIINMDRVAVVRHMENGSVWINFQGPEKGSTDLTLTPDEGTKLWDYLLNQSQDLME
jgi:hypothetical protein